MIWTLLRLPCTVVAAIKQLVARTFFLAVVFSVITWSSILLYGMFYWSYIPKSSHLFPVHLHFESRSCPEGFCDYPMANVTVVRPGYGEYLARGQRYKIYLDLEMPESDANQRIGMFTVKIDMITETGEVVRSSLRSGVLRYKSAMVRLFSTLTYIPMLMFGSAEEKQIVSVLLFDRYEEDYERPATQASIVIRNKFIEVYTATLKIYADFTGLRYLLYNWPLCSALIGISTNFFFVALVALLSWHRLAPAKPRRRRRLSRRRSGSSARTEDENVSVSGESLEDEEQPDLVKETIEAQEAVVRRRRQRDLEELNETTSSSEFQWEPTEPSADTSRSTADTSRSMASS